MKRTAMVNDSVAKDNDQFDEYLWPLTDTAWPVDWRRMANDYQLRQRLTEILAHVQTTHVAPRLRRSGAKSLNAVAQITQRIISGPRDGELWELTLHEPVPQALRDEWTVLCAELRSAVGQPAARLRSRLK